MNDITRNADMWTDPLTGSVFHDLTGREQAIVLALNDMARQRNDAAQEALAWEADARMQAGELNDALDRLDVATAGQEEARSLAETFQREVRRLERRNQQMLTSLKDAMDLLASAKTHPDETEAMRTVTCGIDLLVAAIDRHKPPQRTSMPREARQKAIADATRIVRDRRNGWTNRATIDRHTTTNRRDEQSAIEVGEQQHLSNTGSERDGT